MSDAVWIRPYALYYSLDAVWLWKLYWKYRYKVSKAAKLSLKTSLQLYFCRRWREWNTHICFVDYICRSWRITPWGFFRPLICCRFKTESLDEGREICSPQNCLPVFTTGSLPSVCITADQHTDFPFSRKKSHIPDKTHYVWRKVVSVPGQWALIKLAECKNTRPVRFFFFASSVGGWNLEIE